MSRRAAGLPASRTILLWGIAVLIAVAVCDFVGWQALTFCLNDTTSRTNPYCFEAGAARRVVPLVLVLAIPLVLVGAATGVSLRRRAYLPLVLAAVVCIPAAIGLPSALLE
jgi:hypothetical protein